MSDLEKIVDLEKMIKVNSLLILIANYNYDKRIESNRFFGASVYFLLDRLGLISVGESTYKLQDEIYRLHTEVCRILSKDNSYKLICEIGLINNLGIFQSMIGNFVEDILKVKDNENLVLYFHTYSQIEQQIDLSRF